jgi:hypothetical protein
MISIRPTETKLTGTRLCNYRRFGRKILLSPSRVFDIAETLFDKIHVEFAAAISLPATFVEDYPFTFSGGP